MRRLLSVGVVAGLGVFGLVLGSGPAVGASPVELFSQSSPGPGLASVPANVCFVTVVADGGHGGAQGEGTVPAAGGIAAQVTARVPVTPGDSLHVLVAQAGGSGGPQASNPVGGQGGIGGGGGGAEGSSQGGGGGGGGASAVSLGATALVVAAGGGGGGGNNIGGAGGLLGVDGEDGGGGGAGGGGSASGNGGPGGFDDGGGGGGVRAGGAGASQGATSGGAGSGDVGGGGGAGGISDVGATPGGDGGTGTGAPGSGNGAGGQGGIGDDSGGNGGSGVHVTIHPDGGGGGGGGVGFGGGGGGGTFSGGGGGGGYGAGGGGAASAGGGGGGSSFVTPKAASSSSAASTRDADGQVTITYDPATDKCEREGGITVTKQVVGIPPPGTTFRVKVECDGEQDDKTLTFGETGGTKSFERSSPGPLVCEVSEPGSGGATSVEFACDAGKNVECDGRRSFTLFDDDSGDDDAKVEVTVTNTFPAAPVVLAPTFTG